MNILTAAKGSKAQATTKKPLRESVSQVEDVGVRGDFGIWRLGRRKFTLYFGNSERERWRWETLWQVQTWRWWMGIYKVSKV